jgi:hypothetical protein
MSNEDPIKLFTLKDHHNDEELVILAKDLMHYASKGLKDLRDEYPTLPRELMPHELFYKNLIRTASEFLMQTKNWYNDKEPESLP